MNSCPKLHNIDCIQKVITLLKAQVQPWVKELIKRSVNVVVQIIKSKGQLDFDPQVNMFADNQDDNIHPNDKSSFYLLKDQDNDIEVVSKIIEMVQNLFRKMSESSS